MVRVFIASSDWSFRSALLQLVESEPGLVVIGMSGRADGLPTMVRASQPEVLLLDYELARESNDRSRQRPTWPARPPAIIVLGSDAQAKASSLAAGADAFISKNVPPDETAADPQKNAISSCRRSGFVAGRLRLLQRTQKPPTAGWDSSTSSWSMQRPARSRISPCARGTCGASALSPCRCRPSSRSTRTWCI